jgi:hypothetical protein
MSIESQPVFRFARLAQNFGNLPDYIGKTYAVAAGVLLKRAGFTSGVTMAISGTRAHAAILVWEEVTPADVLLAQEHNEQVKNGASGVALLLADELHGWQFLMFSGAIKVGGNGIDFYVGPPPFKRFGSLATEVVRVEVTGIGPGTLTQSVYKRLRDKRKRLKPYRKKSRSMIAVVDFRTPYTHVEHGPES